MRGTKGHANARSVRKQGRHNVLERGRGSKGMRILALALPLLLVGLAGCTDPDPAPTPAPTVTIAMHGGIYEPDTLTATKGTVLHFEAHDAMHSAKTTDGTYNAGDIAMGSSKDVTLSKAGSFTFKCRFHAGMELDVTVS